MAASPSQMYVIIAGTAVPVGDGTKGSALLPITLTGAVTSVQGTANEITANNAAGAVTLSIPSDFRPPGTLALGGAPGIGALLSSTYSSSAGSGNIASGSFDFETTAATTGTGAGLSVISNGNAGSGTIAQLQGVNAQVSNLNAATITSMRANVGTVSIAGAGGAGDAEAFFANMAGRTGGGSGTITNGYGFYCPAFGAGFTNKWGIFIADTAANNQLTGTTTVLGTPANNGLTVSDGTHSAAIGIMPSYSNALTAGTMVIDFSSVLGAAFAQNGSVVSEINGNNGTYTAVSDARLKDWAPAQTDYWPAIEKMEVGDFTWKIDGRKDFGGRAQQFYEALAGTPAADAVVTRRDDDSEAPWMLGDSYYGRFALWGVKELQKHVVYQDAVIKDLARRLSNLENRQ